MRIIVEFDMVDMSMHKHVTFFRGILREYQAGIRSIKILEPDERMIRTDYLMDEDKKKNLGGKRYNGTKEIQQESTCSKT